MFVQNLNDQQKQILMSLAQRIVAADGVIHEKEQLILDYLGQQCPGTDAAQTGVISGDDLADAFPNQRSIVSLILELLGAAYADESFDQAEKEVVEKIAADLCVPEDLLEQMEAWVQRQMILTKEAELMMEA